MVKIILSPEWDEKFSKSKMVEIILSPKLMK